MNYLMLYFKFFLKDKFFFVTAQQFFLAKNLVLTPLKHTPGPFCGSGQPLPVSPLLLLLAEMEHMRSLGHGYLPHLAAPCTPQFDR